MTRRGTDATSASATGTDSWDRRWESLLPHRDTVVRLARIRGAGADAEDVAQEALLRAASYPGLDLTRARSYLAKIAANLVVDLHRRSARDERLRLHAGLVPPPRVDSEAVEDRDLAQRATQFVSDMTPELRTILFRRRDGATWSQIGQELGEPPARAEMRYRRAVLPLRQRLRTA
jgi:RNA polymerase sigma factor (sigma-70 family)